MELEGGGQRREEKEGEEGRPLQWVWAAWQGRDVCLWAQSSLFSQERPRLGHNSPPFPGSTKRTAQRSWGPGRPGPGAGEDIWENMSRDKGEGERGWSTEKRKR